MTTPFATPDDVADVWEPLTPAQETLAESLIAIASNKLRLLGRRRGKDMDAIFASDPLLASAITTAVVNAVKRVLMNPKALRQYSETTGPFSESGTIDSAVSSGSLYLDSGDLPDLFPQQSGYRSFRVRHGLRL